MSEIDNKPTHSGSARTADTELRQGAISWIQVLAQSVAHIGPTAAVAVLVSFVFAQAGYGAWLSWALGVIAMLAVAYCVALLTRRFRTTGSLYELVTRSIGPAPGFITGWAQFFGYLCGIVPLVIGFALFAGVFLTLFGLPGASPGIQLIFYFVAIVLPGYLAYRDIRLSTNLLLILEATSMVAIVILLLLVMARHGVFFDAHQFAFPTFSLAGLLTGVVTVVYALAGYESAAALGVESQHGQRSVPRAIIGSLILVALFFVFNAYGQTLGFEGLKGSLARSEMPLNDLASGYGLDIFQYIVTVGVVLSAFAAIIANFNHIPRVMFTMGRRGFLPASLARVHPRSRTPLVAIIAFGAATFLLVVFGLLVLRLQPLELFALLGGLSGFGLLASYFFATIAVPIYLRRNRIMAPLSFVIAVLGLLVILGVFIATMYPPPAPPANLFPIVFAIFLILVLLLYWALRARRSTRQSIEEDGQSLLESEAPYD